jgi:hypothetical protein
MNRDPALNLRHRVINHRRDAQTKPLNSADFLSLYWFFLLRRLCHSRLQTLYIHPVSTKAYAIITKNKLTGGID